MAKQIECYVIRNARGQFLASYRADNAKRALSIFEMDQQRENWVFRRSTTRVNMTGITATPEQISNFWDEAK